MQTKKKGCEHMLVEAFETAFPNHDFGWRQSGSSALGFCPFHNDKHQRSLSVYLNDMGEERWHCFAESIGGGLIELSSVLGFQRHHPLRVQTTGWCNMVLFKKPSNK